MNEVQTYIRRLLRAHVNEYGPGSVPLELAKWGLENESDREWTREMTDAFVQDVLDALLREVDAPKE